MKIGNVELTSNILLAPMAGVTDFAFRSLAKQFGAGLTYTEMISAKGLVMSKNREIYHKMLFTLPTEHPVAVQIFGSDPEIMAKACQLPELEKFDIIDINIGCPAPKIVKNGDGSALLLNCDLAVEIAKRCVKATTKPITVKMRVGYDDNHKVCVELAKRLEEVGVKAITIHGRTREQQYSGKANLEIIKEVKNAVKIPVIGNGDVCDNESLEKMISTGVDAVMVGRASMGAPWIFYELTKNTILSNQDKFETIKNHVEMLREVYDEKYLTLYMRKHFLWYVKGMENASSQKVKLAQTTSIDEALKILKELFLKK